MEGIGLIEKRNKNCIKWKGAIAGENTEEAGERLALLQVSSSPHPTSPPSHHLTSPHPTPPPFT